MLPDPGEAEPFRIPIEDVFDLHTIPPRDVKAAVEEYLVEAHARGFPGVRIIHGRGIGVQREMVRSVLARTPFVSSFRDAPAEAGGWGATVVSFGSGSGFGLGEVKEVAVDWVREYDETLADAEELVRELSQQQFNWRVKPGSWSIGECLDHLAIIDRIYGAKVAHAVSEARKQNVTARGPYRHSSLHAFLLRFTEPPPKWRVPAPGGLAPKAGVYEVAITMEEFRKGNRQMAKLAEESAGLDLAAVKVPAPGLSFWKWPIGLVLPLAVAHERRHLYQARQVRGAAGFPSG